MSLSSVSGSLVIADIYSSYFPAMSTVSNLVDIFIKCVVLPFLSQQDIQKDRYYTYVQEKSLLRCVVLLVPILGNLLVYMYDKFDPQNRQAVLMNVAQNGMALRNTPLQGDRGVALVAAQQFSLAYQWASQDLQDDRDFVLATLYHDGSALQWISRQFQNDRDVILTAVRRYGLALEFAGELFQNDEEIVVAAIKQNGVALRWASENLRSTPRVVIQAVTQRGDALIWASEELRNNPDFQRAAEENPPQYA